MRLQSTALCILALTLALLGDLGTAVRAQPLNYHAFSTLRGSPDGTLPFWHYANTRGQFRRGSTTNWLSGAGLTLPFQRVGQFQVSAGTEVIGRLSDASNSLHLHTLYGTVQHRGVRLSVGRFSDTIGLGWDDLSMGSMMVSRNAPPVPMMKLFTPDFLDVPWTHGHVQVRGRWSDGQLGAERVVESALLHQKTFYLKFNVADVSAIGGLVQNTVWGGTGRPTGWNDYVRVVSGSLEGTKVDQNRTGNTIAAYDFALQYDFTDWRLQATRLFYLEDTVSMQFRSPWDGVWSLGIRRQTGRGWVNSVLYEHMNTIQQDALPGAPRGRAGYYGHFVYESGWTYQGTVLGTPLLVFDPETNQMENNMVIAHHVGLNGTPTKRLGYQFRVTYSRNYGVCEDQIITGTCEVLADRPAPPDQTVRPRGELRKDQYSVLGRVRYRLPGEHNLQVFGSLAIDMGEYYDNRVGGSIGLRWNGTLPFN